MKDVNMDLLYLPCCVLFLPGSREHAEEVLVNTKNGSHSNKNNGNDFVCRQRFVG